MASGLSVSEMATEGGCGVKVAVGGGAGRGRGSLRSTGASWATVAVGVRGDTGGRSGVGDFERLAEWWERVEASLDEAGRVLVSTRSAGMAAWREKDSDSWHWGRSVVKVRARVSRRRGVCAKSPRDASTWTWTLTFVACGRRRRRLDADADAVSIRGPAAHGTCDLLCGLVLRQTACPSHVFAVCCPAHGSL